MVGYVCPSLRVEMAIGTQLESVRDVKYLPISAMDGFLMPYPASPSPECVPKARGKMWLPSLH